MAHTTVLQEWLRLACRSDAHPELVRRHLVTFRAMSGRLLDYVVNIADGNGNTALHYSVSHANFPVVRQLLDSGEPREAAAFRVQGWRAGWLSPRGPRPVCSALSRACDGWPPPAQPPSARPAQPLLFLLNLDAPVPGPPSLEDEQGGRAAPGRSGLPSEAGEQVGPRAQVLTAWPGLTCTRPHAGVCQVDRQNRAGYSPLMLTALATLKTQDDIETVTQLFRLGDVNARASQVGGPWPPQPGTALALYGIPALPQPPRSILLRRQGN